MTTPVAKIQVALNNGAYQSGGITAAFGTLVAITATNTSGWSSALWQIYDYPPGFSAPAGWSTDASGVIYYQPTNPTVPPAAFNLPASSGTTWGSYALRLTVSGNPAAHNPDGSPNPAYVPTLTDESTMINIPSPVLGMRGIAANETVQFDPLRAWVGGVMQSLRKLDTPGGGGGAVAPLTLTGSSDTPQLTVKAWTTQTTAIQAWQTNGGATVASVSLAGLLSGSGVDAATAGVFTIGAATATGVTVTPTLTCGGGIYSPNIDRSSVGALNIGYTNATSIVMASGSCPTTIRGALNVSTIDTAAAGALTVAGATATSLALGSGTCATTVGGTLGVTGVTTLSALLNANAGITVTGAISATTNLTVTNKLSLAAGSGDYIALGASPSVTGAIRLANTNSINGRNGANNGDVTMLYTNSSNTVWVGDSANSSVIALQSSTGFSWYQGGTARLSITSGGLALICAGMTFHQAFTSGVSQNAAASDVATTAFTVKAMDAYSSAVTNKNGGDLALSSGLAASGGINGYILLQNVVVGTTSPGAGGAGALPATPKGYASIKINSLGVVQIPYY